MSKKLVFDRGVPPKSRFGGRSVACTFLKRLLEGPGSPPRESPEGIFGIPGINFRGPERVRSDIRDILEHIF